MSALGDRALPKKMAHDPLRIWEAASANAFRRLPCPRFAPVLGALLASLLCRFSSDTCRTLSRRGPQADGRRSPAQMILIENQEVQCRKCLQRRHFRSYRTWRAPQLPG